MGTYESEGPKIEETRGCTTLCCTKQVCFDYVTAHQLRNSLHFINILLFQGNTGLVCVQKVQKILIFEVFPSTELRNSVPRFRKLTEFTLHNHIQMVDIINDRLAVATDKFIAFYNLYDSKRYEVISIT